MRTGSLHVEEFQPHDALLALFPGVPKFRQFDGYIYSCRSQHTSKHVSARAQLVAVPAVHLCPAGITLIASQKAVSFPVQGSVVEIAGGLACLPE